MENKQVYTLSVLKKRFLEIAKDDGLESADSYQSKRFKLLLSSIWPELSFIYQNGASDLVCSCTLTVEDALKAAEKSEKLRRKSTEEDEELVLPDETDESIVHRAVGILRKKICEINKKLEHEYYAVDEIYLQSQKMYVDPLLHKAVYWLSDGKGYLNASAPPDDLLDPKLISVACDITTLVTTMFSPKHLGLGVHLFNEFGSRHLIEEMNSMGYCISYNELRQFLSSAAYHISNNCVKTPSGGLVPDSIIPRDKGGKLIVASGDNWDHNEKTVDGKQTTHAMTSILVSPKSLEKQTKQRLPRVKEKTFDSRCMPGGSLCSIIPYRKPISRPNPEFDPPVDVSEVKPIASKVVSEARLKELLYNFGRCSVFCDDLSEPKTISPWSVFHARSQRTTEKAVSNVAFNPIIMAKPTDHSTVYTTLLRMKESVNALGQEHVPVFFDMALLSKALEIIWARKEELSGVIAFEGGMHLLMSIFAGIGHLYGNIGLRQLLIDSDLYAAGTVSMIMTGKDFDRAMTAYKLIDETLQIRFLKNFEVWCIENNKDIPDDFVCTLNQLRNESDNVELSETSEKLCKQIEEHICPLLNEFRNEGRIQSPTFKLWDDYLTRVSLPLKLFIASTRTGNLDLNKYAKVSLLPLPFASNRSTYSRYMVIEALQMNRLPADIEKGFSDGLFTAKLSEGKFNNVWIDYTLETTENKALKGSGGIIGLTLKENALARWFLSRPVSSHYSMTFHDNLSKKFNNETSSTYRGDKKAKRELVDRSVKKLTSMFDGNFIDPFDLKNNPKSLVNFATAEHVPKETEKSMLYCLDAGRDMLEKFITERLIVKDGKTSPEKSFYDPLPRSKVKSTTQERNICTNRHTTKISNDVMFQRLLAVNAYKQVPSERVFAFENTTVPLRIFSEDGLMLSGKKSDFMEKLEQKRVILIYNTKCGIWCPGYLLK